MKNSRKFLSLSLVVFLISLLLGGCKDGTLEDIFDRRGKDRKKDKLQVIDNSEFGKILVDGDKRSLYFFAGDVAGESNCNGGCADVWPPLIGKVSQLKIAMYLDKDDFSTIQREDGEYQITYKGWPLYYFSPEGDGVREEPGETLGDGRGNLFYIAKPNYTVMLGNQSVEEGADPVIYMVDDQGVTLYRSINDDENVSNCAGGCAGVWPPFVAPEKLVLPSSLSENDFSEVEREDDLGPQLAYKGSPLYYFTPDEKIRGNTLGQGGAGETFFVVEPVF